MAGPQRRRCRRLFATDVPGSCNSQVPNQHVHVSRHSAHDRHFLFGDFPTDGWGSGIAPETITFIGIGISATPSMLGVEKDLTFYTVKTSLHIRPRSLIGTILKEQIPGPGPVRIKCGCAGETVGLRAHHLEKDRSSTASGNSGSVHVDPGGRAPPKVPSTIGTTRATLSMRRTTVQPR